MTLVAGGTYRQAPPTTAKLNWQHPLANNLIGLIAGRRILVGTNRGGLAAGTTINVSTAFGAAYAGASHGANALCTLPAQNDTSSFSMAWAGNTAAQQCLGFFAGTHGVAAIVADVTSSGFNFTDATGGQANTLLATPGRDLVIVAVKNGLNLSAFVTSASGVAKSTTNPGSGNVGLISQPIFYGPDNFAPGNNTSFAAVWTRALTDAEARSVIADPFQMIAV